jgi:CIC family chloride channel protein
MAPETIRQSVRLAEQSIRRLAKMACLGVLVGVVAALLANVFVAGIGWLNDVLLISARSRMMQTDAQWIVIATLAVPTLGGLIVGLLHKGIAEGRAHGPAEVIAAVQTRRGRLPARPALLSGLSSLVSLGSGASVGQYGPLVHLGGSVGSVAARLFRTDVTVDNIAIACGVAAAISTVFNAPIAGILFAHELILRHFALRAFAPIAIASIAGYVVANAILPQQPLIQINPTSVLHFWEYGLFLILGVCSALIAVTYMHSILAVSRVSRRLPLPKVFKPAVAGAVLGLTALWVPEILGIGSETLRFAFIDGAYGQWELLLVLVLKLLATAWCLGMGFSGGVFSPALVIGSLFGALFGTLVGICFGGSTSEVVVYAVCGMVAVTAPVIGAPLTAVIIIFELTGNYPLTIAALASVALANLVASLLVGRSFFDRQLQQRGLDLSGGRSKALLVSRTIDSLINRRHLALEQTTSVGRACAAMGEAQAAEACLVDDEGRYLGKVMLQALIAQPAEQPALTFRVADDLIMNADTSLWEAMEVLQHFVGESVPVVGPDNKLEGIVFESDLIRTYLHIMAEMRREEYASD